jgi:hypothetical protein
MSNRKFIVLVLSAAGAAKCYAYPEFQLFVQKTSGRNVNCAMCHAHPDGPDGLKPGQVGSLDVEGIERLNRARAAFQPGEKVESPILNEFGNHIINVLGKQKFLELRQEPQNLGEALGNESDLDDDGIPDAQEFLMGTHPLDAQSGAPLRLFLHNLNLYRFHIVMMALATGTGLFGLNNLLHGLEQFTTKRRN